jgi:electron transfer flavoprotein alpha/beta subunit
VKLVVCLKQVPRLDRVRFDKANRIVREDVAAITNPLDLRALAHGLALRASCGGELVALTMGPPQAR